MLLMIGGALLWLGVSKYYSNEEQGEGEPRGGFAVRPAAIDPTGFAYSASDAGGDPAFGPAAAGAVDSGTDASAAGAPAPPAAIVPPPATGDEDGFAFTSDMGDPVELGRVVVHESRKRLTEYFLRGPGLRLPVATQKLVSAFVLAIDGNVPAGASRAEGLDGAEGLTTAQVELLRAVLTPLEARPVAAGAFRRDPLALAMYMELLEREAAEAQAQGDDRTAAEDYSELLQLELDAPWAAEVAEPDGWSRLVERWSTALNRAQDGHRFNPRGEWVSVEYEVKKGQSLILIRKELVREDPRLILCTGLIERVNRLGKYLQPGDILRIPTETPDVIADLDARVLLYRHGGEVLRAYEIGIGMEGHATPTGGFTVGEKQKDPSWMPLGGPSIPFGAAGNPLGTRWIAWLEEGVKNSYGFHGTSVEDSVGRRVSQGCIRMRNPDVEELFELIPIGAAVTVRP
ncbi:MAG: L,D-transpeptidase [Planctomycetota bacterium]|nr:MAG: L,D-transpeptidase [Planctomycetota bacterium]